jgi:opacity protein-like surface antigen
MYITKQTAIYLLVVVSFMCGAYLQAEELGQPVRFSIGVSGRMTDNRDAVEDNKQDNVDLFVRPRIDVVYEGGNAKVDLFYIPSYRYRTEPGDNQDDSTWQHEFGVLARREVSKRTRLRVNDSLLVTDDPKIEEGGVTLRGDLSYFKNVIEGGLNYDLLEFSNVDISLNNSIKRYEDDDIAATSDEDQTTIKAQHRHQISRTLRSVLTGSYAMYGYDDELELDRNFNSLTAAIGVEKAFTPNLLGGVSVGWQTRDNEDSDLDSDGAPYVNATIEGLANADLRLGLVAGMGVRDADSFPFVAQEYSEIRGFSVVNVTPKLALRVVGTYRMSEYDEEDVPTALAGMNITGGDEVTIVGDAQLSFAVSEQIALEVGHRFEDIDSDIGQSYTRNTSRIGGTVSF